MSNSRYALADYGIISRTYYEIYYDRDGNPDLRINPVRTRRQK